MPHDYPLEELSPRGFEQLTVALAMKVLGNGVSAFGMGPDGGREATYEGRVSWSSNRHSSEDTWDGYVVVQAKQCQEPRDVSHNANWLWRQIEGELNSWAAEDSKRVRIPNYIIFVTNVRLSSVAGSGGIDTLERLVHDRVHDRTSATRTSLADRGLKGWKIWHRDQVNALLTAHSGVRNAFPAMLTAGDVLHRLSQIYGIVEPGKFREFLLAHGRSALPTERWVNFSEAGGTSRQSVENVIVDLPISGPNGFTSTALTTILEHGDQVLKKSMTTEGHRRHVVLTGQPGNGKSTVSRFLTQLYRSRFLEEDLTEGTGWEVAEGTRTALGRLSLQPPKNRRWPMRVDLAEMADDLGPSGEKSLLRWLSEKVTLRAHIDVKPATLHQWLRSWPSILILDGLDEVTSQPVRRRILDEIEAFVEEVDEQDADVFLVVTTRPMGYTERISPKHFIQLDLGGLDATSAIRYGELVTTLRLADDLDLRDRVLDRFKKHAMDRNMLRLMKTPLQVLIMTFILEHMGNLPADRYQLFWRYFETVYQREAGKNTSLSSLLTEHRSAITELHESIGLVLQVQSETSFDSRALLPLSELRAIARARMIELGHEPGRDANQIADRIVTAATERLVLLVPHEDDSVAFEIRSLQELMAARSLSNAPDDFLKERLTVAAASPHWRNTWIFTAGRLFSEGPDHRRDLVCDVVERIDARPNWPGWLYALGPELAADLLAEGLASTMPKWRRRLIDVALRALDDPAPLDYRSLARGLAATLDTRNNRTLVRAALKDAFAGTPQARETASHLVQIADFGPPIPGQPEPRTYHPEPTEEIFSVAELLRPHLNDIEIDSWELGVVTDALEEMENLHLLREADGQIAGIDPDAFASWDDTVAALRQQETSEALELLFRNLSTEEWHAKRHLAETIWPDLARRPVGEILAPNLAD